MSNLPHIKIGSWKSDQVVLEIEDTEVFDYIEDYLTEKCDIRYQFMEESTGGDQNIYKLYFPKSFSREDIESELFKLEPQKIERIYNINNPNIK